MIRIASPNVRGPRHLLVPFRAGHSCPGRSNAEVQEIRAVLHQYSRTSWADAGVELAFGRKAPIGAKVGAITAGRAMANG
jgi:hypothetical protein